MLRDAEAPVVAPLPCVLGACSRAMDERVRARTPFPLPARVAAILQPLHRNPLYLGMGDVPTDTVRRLFFL